MNRNQFKKFVQQKDSLANALPYYQKKQLGHRLDYSVVLNPKAIREIESDSALLGRTLDSHEFPVVVGKDPCQVENSIEQARKKWGNLVVVWFGSGANRAQTWARLTGSLPSSRCRLINQSQIVQVANFLELQTKLLIYQRQAPLWFVFDGIREFDRTGSWYLGQAVGADFIEIDDRTSKKILAELSSNIRHQPVYL